MLLTRLFLSFQSSHQNKNKKPITKVSQQSQIFPFLITIMVQYFLSLPSPFNPQSILHFKFYDSQSPLPSNLLYFQTTMISRIVQHFLSKYFQQIFYGINHKNIHTKLLDGKLLIQNIGLQPQFISKLNLPIELRASFVQKLSLEFAWRKQNSNLKISIQSIYAIVIDKFYDNDKIKDNLRKGKQKLIKDVLKEFASRLKEAKESMENKEQTSFEKYLLKQLDNIELKIGYIHLRYENRIDKFSFGLTIHDILLETRDHEGRKIYFERDKTHQSFVRQVLEIKKFGIYWNANEELMLNEKNHSLITSHMLARNYEDNTSNNGYEYSHQNLSNGFSNQNISNPNLSHHNLSHQESNPHHQLRLKYIFTLKIYVTLKKLIVQNGIDPEIQGNINIQQTNCKVSQIQYSQIIKIVKYFLSHQSRVKEVIQSQEIQNYKPKAVKEILVMMKQKYHTQQTKKYMQKNIREYLLWTFTEIRERVIKNKFIDLICGIPKKLTPESILRIPRVLRIIHKVENEKLKEWLFEALIKRTENEQKSPFFELIKKNNDFLTSTRKAFSKLSYIEKQSKLNENYVWLKLNGNLQKATFEIAETTGLGLNFSFTGVQVDLNLRNTNFFIEMEINDVNLVFFNDPSVNRAETSILRKNTISHQSDIKLMKIRFEKNPINKPYVFTEMDFEFRSIEINIFPSTIKQLYKLFTEGIIKTKQQQKQDLKRKPPLKSLNKSKSKEELDYQAIRNSGFQKNIINARIHSPWIIMPLIHINDNSSDCWVIRLGDLQIITPNELNSKQQLYYQKYNVMLQNFELKYFSSIRFFYNWLKFKDFNKLDKLLGSGLIENGKIIQIIKPFSCSIHAKTLKKFLSTNILDSTLNYKFQVDIQQIELNFSTFIINKIKKSFQNLEKGESEIPIQLDRDIIFKISKYQQTVIVNYKDFENFKFYLIYHNGYFYLFLNENSLIHSLIVPYMETKVVLRSFQSEKLAVLNEENEGQMEIFFDLHGEMLRWKGFLEAEGGNLRDGGRHLNSSQAELDNLPKIPSTYKNSMDNASDLKDNASRLRGSIHDIKQISSKYSLTCKMPKLSFKFIDEHETEFLNGTLDSMELHLEQKYCRQIILNLNQFVITGPTFKQLPLLFSSEQYGSLSTAPLSPSNPPRTKFMQLQIKYDEFTNKLREINLKFKKLTIAWKVELIQKILTFFNIDIQSGPTLPNRSVKKREISIKAMMESWDIVLINNHYIFAEVKLSDVLLGYSVMNSREIYSFNGKIEFYGLLENDLMKLFPVFNIRKDTNILPKFQLNYTSGSLHDDKNPSLLKPDPLSPNTSFPTLKITIEGYQINYHHQFFNRLFNYTLNKFIGSITSKFRIKKDYDIQYIFQTLKIKKPSIFDILLLNCNVIFPGDISEKNEKLLMCTKRITVNRNLNPLFLLQSRQFPSKKGDITVNYEKMIVTCHDAELYYLNEIKKEKIPVIEDSIGFEIQYNKYNLSKQYFPILRDVKEFDLTANIVITFQFPLELQLYKSIFLQLLRTYYRNIKQKDNLALEYEPQSLHPTPRVYTVNIPTFKISFLEEIDNKFSKYFMVNLPFVKITAKELRSDISAVISSECLFAQYYDDGWINMIQPIDTSNSPIKIQMRSVSGDVNAQIKLYGLNIIGDLNYLNNIIDFVDFDPKDADNFRMPKKPRKSFQNFKIFMRESIIGLQSGGKTLEVKGVFFIDYLKNPEGILDQQVKLMFGENVTHSEINQKDIKVNVQDIEVAYNGIRMSQLPNVMYRRHEFTNRIIGKKLRKQYIFLQQFLLCFPTNILQDFQKLYKRRLKKDTLTKKSYFDSNSIWTPKRKYDQKRIYTVSTEPISFILLGSPLHKSIQPILKATIQILELTAILINSSPKSISTLINTSICNKGYKLDFLELVNASSLQLNFQTQDNYRKISFSANTIKLNCYNINESSLNKLLAIKDSFHISSTTKHPTVTLKNDTDIKIKIKIQVKEKEKLKNEEGIIERSLGGFEEEVVEVNQLDYCKLYMGGIELILGIKEQMFVLDLGEVQIGKLFNIGNLVYMLIGYGEGEDILIQFQTKFRLQNLTGYRFQYALVVGGKNGKLKGVLQEKKTVNFNFESGDTLILKELNSQEEISLDLKKTSKKLKYFNISLELENKAVYVCKIHPKILVTNHLPMSLHFSSNKHHIEIPSFSTKQFPSQHYLQKKQLVITINNENYRSQTSLFKSSSSTSTTKLQLISSNPSSQKLHINFSSLSSNSITWVFTSPLILLNISYHNLTLKQNLKVNHLSTLTLNEDELLRIGNTDIIPKTMKAHQQIQISPLLTMQKVVVPETKTAVLLFNPQTLFVNESSCDVVLNGKHRVNKNQALPLQQDPSSLPVSVNGITDKVLRSFDFTLRNEFYFFVKTTSPQKPRETLKISLNTFEVRKIVLLENNTDYYSIKNALTGYTLIVKQQGQKYGERFVVKESSEGYFSMEDPMGKEVFEIEFYVNERNKEIREKYVFDIHTQESYTEFTAIFDNQPNTFSLTFKKLSKGISLTVSPLSPSAPSILELSIKHLTLSLVFSPSPSLSSELSISLSKLYFKQQSHPSLLLQKYLSSIDSLDIRYKDSSILKKSKPGPFVEFECGFKKWNKHMEVDGLVVKCNSVVLNLKEDVVLEVCNILKNINLINDKKVIFRREKGELVGELLKGKVGVNQVKDLSMKFYKNQNKSAVTSPPATPPKLTIASLLIHPISLNLSYSKKTNNSFNDFKTHPFLKYLIILPDIREMRIELPELKQTNYEGDMKGLKKKVTGHVKNSIPNHILSSVNSLSLFESPVDAMDMIGNVIDALWSRKE